MGKCTFLNGGRGMAQAVSHLRMRREGDFCAHSPALPTKQGQSLSMSWRGGAGVGVRA